MKSIKRTLLISVGFFCTACVGPEVRQQAIQREQHAIDGQNSLTLRVMELIAEGKL